MRIITLALVITSLLFVLMACRQMESLTSAVSCPKGYTVNFITNPVNNFNQQAISFQINNATVGDTYNYTISSSGGYKEIDLSTPTPEPSPGATPTDVPSSTSDTSPTPSTTPSSTPNPIDYISGNGVITSSTQIISGVNTLNLNDGTLTLRVWLKSNKGNQGKMATDTVAKNTVLPDPCQVSFVTNPVGRIGIPNKNNIAFQFRNSTIGEYYEYRIVPGTINDFNNSNVVSGSGIITSFNQLISGINCSQLPDGLVTLFARKAELKYGNVSSWCQTNIQKDTQIPSGYSVEFSMDTVVNNTNYNALSFTIKDAPPNSTFVYDIFSDTDGGIDKLHGTGVIAAGGNQTITGVDATAHIPFWNAAADNYQNLTISLSLTNAYGDAGEAVTNTIPIYATPPNAPSDLYWSGINAMGGFGKALISPPQYGWTAGAVSSTGQIQTAIKNNGYIYTSNDFGNTWSKATVAGGGKLTWTLVAMSLDGKYQVATTGAGLIFVSTNYGANWTDSTPMGVVGSFTAAAVSADGTYMTVVNDAGKIYVSSDKGATFGTVINTGSKLSAVAMSSDGSVQIATDNSNANNGTIYTSINSGVNWDDPAGVAITVNRTINGVAISANGTKRTIITSVSSLTGTDSQVCIYNGAAYSCNPIPGAENATLSKISMTSDGITQYIITTGAVYKSVDSGATWNTVAGMQTGNSFSMARGDKNKILVATSDKLYESMDGGTTWRTPYNNIYQNWTAVALNNTGSKEWTVGNGYIYFSADKGKSWSIDGGNSNGNWKGIAISKNNDGVSRTAVIYNGLIMVYNTTTNNWEPRGGPGVQNWRGVAMSGDGSKQTVVSDDNGIYTSNGANDSTHLTWLLAQAGNFVSVAMSNDGKYQTAVDTACQMYVSSDTGATWANPPGPGACAAGRTWTAVAISSDGKYQTAVANATKIYTSSDYGQNWSNANNSAALDWVSVAMSNNGQKQIAAASQGNIYISYDYGKTWRQRDSDGSMNKYWTAVGMSGDGLMTIGVEESGGNDAALYPGGYIYTSFYDWILTDLNATLNWTKSDTGVGVTPGGYSNQYIQFYDSSCVDALVGTPIAIGSTNTQSYNFNLGTLTNPGQIYCGKVGAVNTAKNIGWSSGSTVYVMPAPLAATGLSGSQVGSSWAINAVWTPSTSSTLENQKISFFQNSNCIPPAISDPLPAAKDLQSKTTSFYWNFPVPAPGPYSFMIYSINRAGIDVTSTTPKCSGPITVN